MASYSVLIKRTAAKELERLPHTPRQHLARQIHAFSEQPRPHGCEKLTGEDLYRIRHGDYRVVYAIDDAERSVLVIRIAHRRDVYR